MIRNRASNVLSVIASSAALGVAAAYFIAFTSPRFIPFSITSSLVRLAARAGFGFVAVGVALGLTSLALARGRFALLAYVAVVTACAEWLVLLGLAQFRMVPPIRTDALLWLLASTAASSAAATLVLRGRRQQAMPVVGMVVALFAVPLAFFGTSLAAKPYYPPPSNRSVETRALLQPVFGEALGRVKAGDGWVDAEVSGAVTDQLLFRALLALAPSTGDATLSVTALLSQQRWKLVEMRWGRTSGRLQRAEGGGGEWMVETYPEGVYPAGMASLSYTGVIPSGVDEAQLRRMASGTASWHWSKP